MTKSSWNGLNRPFRSEKEDFRKKMTTAIRGAVVIILLLPSVVPAQDIPSNLPPMARGALELRRAGNMEMKRFEASTDKQEKLVLYNSATAYYLASCRIGGGVEAIATTPEFIKSCDDVRSYLNKLKRVDSDAALNIDMRALRLQERAVNQ